jgi:HemY protein
MKLVITIIIALAVAVGLALVSMNDPGYVVLSRDPYVVRLPLLMFVLLMFIGFVLLYLLFNFIAGLFRAPKRYGKWRDQSNENNAHKHTMLGYAGLIEGNWAKAETSLLKKLEHNKTPLMNYLGAAYAAQQQGNLAARNQYLDEALEKHPRQNLAIDLTRARLLYQAGEIPESRNCLEGLRKRAPRNVAVVRLLADTYNDLGDWSSLTALLPVMKKLKAFPAEELNNREQLAYDNIIGSPALLQGDQDRAATTWKTLPSAKRKDPEVIAGYVRQLIKAEELKEAEKVLRTALNRKFDPELVYLYGKVESPYLEYQIQLAETLARKHPGHPDLLLTLARLYRFNKEDDKAKEFYKQSITAGGREEAYLDLSSLLEQMGDNDAALFFIKKGLAAINPETESSKPSGEVVLLEGNVEPDARDVMPVVR